MQIKEKHVCLPSNEQVWLEEEREIEEKDTASSVECIQKTEQVTNINFIICISLCYH